MANICKIAVFALLWMKQSDTNLGVCMLKHLYENQSTRRICFLVDDIPDPIA